MGKAVFWIVFAVFCLSLFSIVFSDSVNLIQNPGFELGFTSWTRNHLPTNCTGTENVVGQNCLNGKCLKTVLGNCTYQTLYQGVGVLIPGKEYTFSAKFKTTENHSGYISPYDLDWKDASCQKKGKSFSTVLNGNNRWQTITKTITIPLTDDCGESTANHNWRIYLYGHSPTTNSDEVYYDDISFGGSAPKIQAMYGYDLTTEEAFDKALQKGINTFIIKFNFTENNPLQNNINLQRIAAYAKIKNFNFMPAINFAREPENTVTLERGLFYKNGNLVESGLMPPLNRAYWNYLIEKTKYVVQLSQDPSYKIDGIFIDSETYSHYGEAGYYYRIESNFDDETFNEFVASKTLSNPPQNKFDRYAWLSKINLLNDYYTFVKTKAVELSDKMEKELHAINPTLLIGTYPSPGWNNSTKKYTRPLLFEFYKGWGGTKPASIFGTETYGTETIKGPSYLPAELVPKQEYFSFVRKDIDENIDVYYAGGALLRIYGPQDFSMIKEISDKTNGYWLYTIQQLLYTCDQVKGLDLNGYRLRVNCANNTDNPGCCLQPILPLADYWVTNCCPYYDQAVQDYWSAIQSINYLEQKCNVDGSCQILLGETKANCASDCSSVADICFQYPTERYPTLASYTAKKASWVAGVIDYKEFIRVIKIKNKCTGV